MFIDTCKVKKTGGRILKKLLVVPFILFCSLAHAQWQHSYPRAEGYDHQIYLEGYELPLLASGAMDPAPSPDGKSVVFSARGWLWLMDLESGVADRITFAGGVDSRPEWSPDGKRLAFVRDVRSHFQIVMLDLDARRAAEIPPGLREELMGKLHPELSAPERD